RVAQVASWVSTKSLAGRHHSGKPSAISRQLNTQLGFHFGQEKQSLVLPTQFKSFCSFRQKHQVLFC
ncbi:hypothetical protein, partial [Deinococcus cellulosilyticus]|uniref:hypothetical protein n=1 Tax=Deinococcus cellulosilyticus TaxID=401558 RepID=UPI001C9A13A3